jgi:hypothetical protein
VLASCRSALLDTLSDFAREQGFTMEDAIAELRRAAAESHDELAGLKDRRGFEQARGLTASRISLVHEEDLEFSIRLSDFARRLRERSEGELSRLHLRYMTLLGQSDVAREQIPVGPETVCCGIRGLVEGAGLGSSERLILLERMETALGNRLVQLYMRLNRLLETAGVSPRSLTRAEPEPSAREIQNSFLGETASTSGGSIVELQRALLTRQGSPRQTGQIAPELAAALLDRVLVWLDEQQSSGTQGNVSGRLIGSELGALLSPEARTAVDAIERVFEVEISLPHLPLAARQAIARLRIPLLKLALTDERLLKDPQHPARRLLDAMADATIGLVADTPATHPVCRALDEAAMQIQHGFQRDAGIFIEQLRGLLELTPNRQRIAQQRAAGFQEAANRIEREELCLRFAARALRALCSDQPPTAVRDFLEKHWIRVLTRTLVEYGEKSVEWRTRLMVADRLLWSVQPKTDPESRRQLIQLLPGLLGRMHSGLDELGYEKTARDALLAPCMDLHSAAMRGRATPEANIPSAPSHSELELAALPEVSGLRVLKLSGGVERETPPPEAVTALATGTWIEIALPDERRVRGCLGAISKSRQVFLLVDPDQQGVLAITARALIQQWNSGQAMNLAQSPLFERAAAHALRLARTGS